MQQQVRVGVDPLMGEDRNIGPPGALGRSVAGGATHLGEHPCTSTHLRVGTITGRRHCEGPGVEHDGVEGCVVDLG
jgi:hypothetical protein